MYGESFRMINLCRTETMAMALEISKLPLFKYGAHKIKSEWRGKRKETKQQPGTAVPGNILGCCLVSLSFLCDIPCTRVLVFLVDSGL